MVHLDEPLLDRAGEIGPSGLRSLDAIHLAAALAIGADLGVIFAYDTRLKSAAEAYGLNVASPGIAAMLPNDDIS